MHFFKKLTIAFGLLGLTSTSALACGPSSQCKIDNNRHYYIAMPAGHDGKTPVGAVVFSHGYKGTALGTMKNKKMRKIVSDMGLALIATKSKGDDWDIPYSPSSYDSDGQDEFRYFDNVIDHASANFPIDTKRMMATGFSAGGMVTWNLICARSDKFAAFAPMAGTFWLKIPQGCETPATNVIHIHGKTDRTVPLGGRKIRQTKQGDVPTTIAMYKDFGKFKATQPTTNAEFNFECENHENAAGKIFNYCLFPGRHQFNSFFIKYAWDKFADNGTFK